jgi:hypothetical protein
MTDTVVRGAFTLASKGPGVSCDTPPGPREARETAEALPTPRLTMNASSLCVLDNTHIANWRS